MSEIGDVLVRIELSRNLLLRPDRKAVRSEVAVLVLFRQMIKNAIIYFPDLIVDTDPTSHHQSDVLFHYRNSKTANFVNNLKYLQTLQNNKNIS